MDIDKLEMLINMMTAAGDGAFLLMALWIGSYYLDTICTTAFFTLIIYFEIGRAHV